MSNFGPFHRLAAQRKVWRKRFFVQVNRYHRSKLHVALQGRLAPGMSLLIVVDHDHSKWDWWDPAEAFQLSAEAREAEEQAQRDEEVRLTQTWLVDMAG